MKCLPIVAILLFVFSLFSKNTLGQNAQPLIYSFSYYGNNLWNPGLKAGAGKIWKEKESTNKKGKTRYHQTTLNGNLGFYIDPASHTGVFTDVGLIYRKFYTNDWFYSLGISPVGIYRSFLPQTYEMDTSGEINKVTLPGRFYFSPSGSLGFGKKLKNSSNGWFARANMILLLPYNTYILPLVNVEAGYCVNLRMK
ncbi:MAG: hypothetical protein KDE26_11935 [Bacteroidetes bacterium]|nr:hypothetical protein [Bacteroidota bacterium]MCB0843955.1 hypothetical protein [Bacteroidota bacterium]